MTTVVLDTNLLVSAVLFRGLPSRILSLAQAGGVLFAVSGPVLAEYQRVLAHRKFRLSREEVQAALETQILPYSQMVVASAHFADGPVCRDVNDDMFLLCAVAAEADVLLTGDGDLLALAPVWRTIRIATAAQWLAEQSGN